MTDFYQLPSGKTTGFYLGERGTCGEVDGIILRYHERQTREAAEIKFLRERPEIADE
jgi:hypothetical protein